jgi:hypothetical protein
VEVCAALTVAEIPGVNATVGDDHGRKLCPQSVAHSAASILGRLLPLAAPWFAKATLIHSSLLVDCPRQTGKSPTVEIMLTENWHGPSGKELLRLLRDEPLPGHPRVYVGGDIRTTDTTMTVVRTTSRIRHLFDLLWFTWRLFAGGNDVAARGMHGCQRRTGRGTCEVQR